jgi:hypothetical protein
VKSATAVVSQQGTDFGSLSVTVSGGAVTGSVPAHAMVTFLLNGVAGGSTTSSTASSTTASSTAPPTGPTGCISAQWGQCGGTRQ